MKSLRYILCLLAICSLQALMATPMVNTRIFSDNDENIQGRLTRMLQDKNGYIWISTFNGLIKYDGYQFYKYKSLPGQYQELESNRINNIWENSASDIWCLTGDAIYLFKVKEDRFINVQQVLNSQHADAPKIWEVFCLENGVTWMVSRDGLCFRLEDDDPLGSCQVFSLGANDYLGISKIVLDAKGREWILGKVGIYMYGSNEKLSNLRFVMAESFEEGLWLVASDARMAFFNHADESLQFYDLPVKNNQFHLSVRQNDSTLLICTAKGLYQLSLPDMQSRLIAQGDWQNAYVDSQSRYWALRSDKQFVCITPDGKQQVYPRPADHDFESMRVVFNEDQTGLLWLVFTDTNDLLYLDRESQSFVRPVIFPRSTEEVRNLGFHKDIQGNYWYLHEHELECITLQNTPFEYCPDLLKDEIRAITRDDKGRYWLSYRRQKVALYSPDGQYLGNLGRDGNLHQDKEYSFGASVYTFKQDSRGRMWMGTKAHGLFMLQDDKSSSKSSAFNLQRFMPDEQDPYSLNDSSIYAIEEDDRAQIWIGTFNGGLNLYQDGKFIHYFNHLGRKEQRPKVIRCMKYIGDGQLMIGAREGLYIMDTHFDKVENIRFWHNQKRQNDFNSLADNDVMSICQTRTGEIYVSTNSGGISRILPCESYLSHHLSFENITKQQGLGSEIAYAILEDAQSNLWVVSPGNISRISHADKDITVYDASYFSNSPVFAETQPLMVNNTILIGEASGLMRVNTSNWIEDDYCPPLSFSDCHIDNVSAYLRLWNEDGLHFSRKERDLRLRYAAVDYQDKSHLKYAYFLEGVDKDWNETFATELTYTNLPPGKHVLHLKSTNRYGVWMDNEVLLPVNVTPRFMESVWGWMLLALLMMLIMLVVVWFFQRMYRLRHHLAVERELNDAKLRFFTDISHELRTPLTLIDGPVSEALDDKSLSDQSRYYLEVVQKNVRRMLNLVNQILDFRKVQNKKMHYLLEQINVNQQLRSLMENFVELSQHHQITFQLESSDEDIYLWVDRDKFEKIFFNLLSNAFKYTPDGKSISLRVSQNASSVSIAVMDQGVGIRQEMVEKLFLRYETVMSQNVFKASSGIGLSLVKQFVDGHHATITVSSQNGEGSCFTINFFKGKEHFAQDEQVEFYVSDMVQEFDKQYVTPISVMESEASSEQSTILIVEDNDELRNFMHRILAPNYHILLACNGQEGLRMAKEHWPDLVITDVMMPVMDGFEMIRQIKDDADIYQIPIIVLTAKAGMDDRIGAVEMGVDDYVMKPFSANYIKARVSSLIQQRKKLHQHLMEMLSQGNNPVGYMQMQPNMPDIKPADEIFLQEVMAFMEKNMEEANFTIEDFATALNMGRTTFYNKLKATTGLSPVDFVLQIRIKRAVQLLQSRNFTIAEVAYKTGFNDPKYFSRCFKKFHGVSPSTFLKQLS